jgi:hypothetical protein
MTAVAPRLRLRKSHISYAYISPLMKGLNILSRIISEAESTLPAGRQELTINNQQFS